MSPKNHKVRVGISIGDFNGIGPEIIMKSLKDKTITDFFTPVIFGSGKLFTYQKNIFKLNLISTTSMKLRRLRQETEYGESDQGKCECRTGSSY
jgi:4-hydroxy-L-threonine phosphate dehydrogenase PdxA